MDIEKLWDSLTEIEFITLEQAFALYADREANNLTCEFINTINAESKKISVALRMGAIIALIKLPVDSSGTQEQESMWLLYSRKVKALTEREFDKFFETQKDLALTQIYYSKVIDTNRTFTMKDEFGNWCTKTERELEHWINIEEPRSYDWTPFLCTEDMKEMYEGFREFSDYTLC